MIRLSSLVAMGGLLLALTPAACTPAPPTSQELADQKTIAACRERADSVFKEQNREAVYASDDRLSPFSSSYTPGNTTRGLGDRYGRDTMLANCIRNSAADSATATSGATSAATAVQAQSPATPAAKKPAASH